MTGTVLGVVGDVPSECSGIMPWECWLDAALTRRYSLKTTNNSARMIKNTAAAPMPIPALAPALRLGFDGGGGVDEEDVDEDDAVAVVGCNDAVDVEVAEAVDVLAVVAGSVWPCCRMRKAGLENWSVCKGKISVPVRTNLRQNRSSMSIWVSLTVIVHGKVPGSVMLMFAATRRAYESVGS